MKALFFSRFFILCKDFEFSSIDKNLHVLVLILVFTFGVLQPLIQAQKISKIGANKFEYQGKTYKYSDMDPVFSQNEPSYDYYLKAKNRLKKGKTLGIISLSSLAVGFIAGATTLGTANSFDELNTAALIWIFGSLTTIATAIPALIFHFNGKKHQKKSVTYFNQASGDNSFNDNSLDTKIFLRPSSAGLSIHF